MGADYQQGIHDRVSGSRLRAQGRVSAIPPRQHCVNKDLNQADGIHPNATGEKIMTDNVYKALKPLL